MVIRCIAKVADSYKMDKKRQRSFKRWGSIAYDSRVLSYCHDRSVVSIWTVDGRMKIPITSYERKYLPFIKGEADLVFKKGKFYLCQTVEVPEEDRREADSFIGGDFGIRNIVVTSDGMTHSGEWLKGYREKRQRIRSRVQSRGTKGSKRLLKRLSGRKQTTARIINHTISKSIVASAKAAGKGISIEDLGHIRRSIQGSGRKGRNKRFSTRLGRWNFGQLRMFLTYKSRLQGVLLVVVNPAETSAAQTCSVCYHIGKRKGKRFECRHCGNSMDADINASRNIATRRRCEKPPAKTSTMYCTLNHKSGLNTPSARLAG